MGKTESSPIGLGRNFGRLNNSKIPQGTVLDFAPPGTLSSPEPLGLNLTQFQIAVERGTPTVSLCLCKSMNINAHPSECLS